MNRQYVEQAALEMRIGKLSVWYSVMSEFGRDSETSELAKAWKVVWREIACHFMTRQFWSIRSTHLVTTTVSQVETGTRLRTDQSKSESLQAQNYGHLPGFG